MPTLSMSRIHLNIKDIHGVTDGVIDRHNFTAASFVLPTYAPRIAESQRNGDMSALGPPRPTCPSRREGLLRGLARRRHRRKRTSAHGMMPAFGSRNCRFNRRHLSIRAATSKLMVEFADCRRKCERHRSAAGGQGEGDNLDHNEACHRQFANVRLCSSRHCRRYPERLAQAFNRPRANDAFLPVAAISLNR